MAQITIRGVPDKVRDELAARAAENHQSMQAFLRAELERIASMADDADSSNAEIIREARARLAESPTKVTRKDILHVIHEGRKEGLL